MTSEKKACPWFKRAVVYQIYPRSFCDADGDGIGDLRGIISKLDYLKTLGIDVLWLSPIYQSPNDDNGYDISDYRSIMRDFGTMADFEQLLAKAHDRGLKIMLDLVVNHTSDEHAWFVRSRAGVADNPYRDYYIWRAGKDGKAPNNWGSMFSGPAWQYDPATDMYYLHLFSPKQPDLNWANPRVREEIYEMMRWWLDKGIDGFRMDVINFISKVEGLPDGDATGRLYGDFYPYCLNGPHVHEYLREMNEKVLSHYDIITVGETPEVSIEHAKRYAGEQTHELNMVFQFEHMGLDAGKYGKWSDNRFKLTELKRILSKWQTELYGTAWNSLYWNNHDQPRVVSRFGNDSGPYRVLSAKMLALCLHMMQGTPYIYQGEELGMTNVAFPDIASYRDIETLNAYREYTEQVGVNPEEMMRYIHKISRDNARTPMQWDDSEQAGFTTGTPWIDLNPNYKQINAASQVGDPDSVFSFYQRLIRLRKQYDIITEGKYRLLAPEDEAVYAYMREMPGQALLVVCNFTDRPVKFNTELSGAKGRLLLANYDDTTKEPPEQIDLRPYEGALWLIEA